MKKIAALVISTLFASTAFAAAPAPATPTNITLTAGTLATIRAATDTGINNAAQYNIVAIQSRAGFVKNDFEMTLSANVAAAALDNATTNRFGVVAGSNKGYNVFTGSSVGGSVSQCGAPVAKTTTGLAASLVGGTTLNVANANGCGR